MELPDLFAPTQGAQPDSAALQAALRKQAQQGMDLSTVNGILNWQHGGLGQTGGMMMQDARARDVATQGAILKMALGQLGASTKMGAAQTGADARIGSAQIGANARTESAETSAKARVTSAQIGADARRESAKTMAGGGAGLSPDALDISVDNYERTGGKLPAIAQGRSGPATAIRLQIANRHAEKYPGSNLAGNAADYGADAGSLKKLQSMNDAVEAFSATTGRNIGAWLEAASKIPETGSPLLNKPARWFATHVQGSPEMAAFEAARQTAVGEASKVLTGGTLSAQAVSDSGRKDLNIMLNPDHTVEQQIAAAHRVMVDIENRRAEYGSRLKQIRARMGPSSNQGAATQTTPQPGAPAGHGPVVRTGKNNQTGKRVVQYQDGYQEEQ